MGGDGNPGGIGSAGLGGAIMSVGSASAPATAHVSDSTFLDNQAIGYFLRSCQLRRAIGITVFVDQKHHSLEALFLSIEDDRKRLLVELPALSLKPTFRVLSAPVSDIQMSFNEALKNMVVIVAKWWAGW